MANPEQGTPKSVLTISPTTRIALREAVHNDLPFVDLRVDFLDESTGQFIPTKKGIHLRRDKFLELFQRVLVPYVQALIDQK